MTRIDKISKYHCSGCGACENICPFNAIKLIKSEEGFLYPEIDEEKCTNCGLCYKRCPVVCFENKNNPNPKAYAMMASDKLREKSSSGGMFSILSDYVLEKDGLICGVRYETPTKLVFDFASSKKELEALKGSKYFQAEVGGIYRQLKKYLEEGINILFSACPCQVAGFKNYLGKDYNNLITCDVICHGTPSHKMIESYIESLCELKDIKSLNFRDKSKYLWSTTITLEKFDESKIQLSYQDAKFYQAFGNGTCMRESCYNCKFASLPRCGDFTLGDYWHITEFAGEMNDNYGTSCVLLNNSKAEKLYAKLESKMKKSKEMPLSTATKYNEQLRKPIMRNPKRNIFYKLLGKKKFNDVLKETEMKNHFDVGVIGYWYATNYGSVLTYYSLYKSIEELGYNTVLIDRPDKENDKEPQTVFSRKFMNKMANISPSFHANESDKFNALCDKFVVGSDQMWTRDAIMINGYRFFLDFVTDNKIKVAYAPSFGTDKFNVLPATNTIVSYLLSRFDAISVREDTGVDICKNNFGLDVKQVVDPIFLQDRDFYENIAEMSNKNEKEPFILSYILDPDNEKRNILINIQKKLSSKLINILDGRYNTFEKNNQKLNLPNTYSDVNMEDWVKYFMEAKFVVTDSHHGLAMAVIFNKPFICIMNKSRGATRFTSLLGWLGLLERLVDKNDDFSLIEKLLCDIDYLATNKIIKDKRKESLSWLKDSLNHRHENNVASHYDFVNARLNEMSNRLWYLMQENVELKKELNELKKVKND